MEGHFLWGMDEFNSILCASCGEELDGRKDKRFCDDACRARHHRNHSMPASTLRSVDKILQRNRTLLREFRKRWTKNSSADFAFRWLRRNGFNFDYHTHVEPTPDGRLAIMCYEEGYVLVADGVMPKLNWPEMGFWVAEAPEDLPD